MLWITYMHIHTQGFSSSYMDSSEALLEPEAIYLFVTFLTAGTI